MLLKRLVMQFKKSWHAEVTQRMARISQNELSFLCDLYGSDKGSLYGGGGVYYPWLAHTYTSVYFYLFAPIRSSCRSVFECGLGTNDPKAASSMGITGRPGASLRVWRDFFPNAHVVGADIDRKILFSDERIFTGYIDQTQPETIKQFFSKLPSGLPDKFDIMIDDGLHTACAAICLFENAVPYLATQGIYVIEDLGLSDIPIFEKLFHGLPCSSSFRIDYMLMPIQGADGNNLIIIRRR